MASINLSDEKKKALLVCARKSIQQALNGDWDQKPAILEPDDLGAAFVTLKLHGQLRGCIGTLEAYQSLMSDVWQNAYSAAFRDPRFPPLMEDEFHQVRIEISVLTAPQPISVASEQDLLNRLRPDIDGLILEEGHHRATFLPAVWEALPTPEEFLLHLKRKAGLSDNYWSDSTRFSIYQAINFYENYSHKCS
ncbi:AmmeMemoRadiSam system protein A [Neptunomonas antarctica]|nr:AmmeMemoRadiSam system protein A [Neptunomonas antarctica]